MEIRCLLLIISVTILLSEANDLNDVNDVNLTSWQYFRYPPNSNENNLNPIALGFQRSVAVAVYLRNLIIGDPLIPREFNIVFEEELGKKLSSGFEKKYGYRGEKLIAELGSGKYSVKSNH